MSSAVDLWYPAATDSNSSAPALPFTDLPERPPEEPARRWLRSPFRLTVPLPPPDNHCHASGAYTRYATKAYKEWLGIAGELLSEALGGAEPDTGRWWAVEGTVALGSRGDAQNYLKPVLDLLSGACVVKSKIEKVGGLWDDDSRVGEVRWTVAFIKHAEPHIILRAFPLAGPPTDCRAVRLAEDKAEKARLREIAREERAAKKVRVPK